ncbi:MAG: glycosyltransferase family 87 protein [Gemmataceae bacterium]
MSRRLGWMTAALVVALGLQLYSTGAKAPQLPLHDYVEYWAAGRLLARGDNPYDKALIDQLEREAGRDDDPILMWNPPWALPLVLPLGGLDARTGHLAWLGAHLLALVASAELLWRVYGGRDELRFLAPVVALTFVPALSALIVGQISPLMLLGAAGFLWFVRQGRDLEAGVAVTLLAVKPHMAYLFWVALLVWAVGSGRWRLLAAGALAGVALTATAAAFRPSILADYWATARQTPAEYASPTPGFLLRWALGSPAFGWQFVPLAPGLAWLAWYGWRYRSDWDWPRRLPMLLLVSALTAAYGAWLFDLVLLLVPVLDVAARLSREGPNARRWVAAGAHLAILAAGLTLMLGPFQVQYLHYIWITPAVLVAYLALTREEEKEPSRPAASPAASG